MHIERSEAPREREFLLFSDCLIWLAPSDESTWTGYWNNSGSKTNLLVEQERPGMIRSRSKSEAELPIMRPGPPSPAKTRSVIPPPKTGGIHRHSSASGVDDRWVFKGKAELVDLEVVITPPREPGEERRFEVLSPEGSFVVFAGNPCHFSEMPFHFSLLLSQTRNRKEMDGA